MKRFASIVLGALLVSAPMNASALEALTDNGMNDVTGQAGVSIALDDIVIYQSSIADSIYWDTDGMTHKGENVGAIGAAGIKITYGDGEMEKLTTLDGITDASVYGTDELDAKFGHLTGWDAGTIGVIESANIAAALATGNMDPTNGNIAGFITGASPLTIDVGTCEALSTGWNHNGGPAAVRGGILQGAYDQAYAASIAGALDPDAPTPGEVTAAETAGTDAQANVIAAGLDYAPSDVVGVVIGLPTIEIKTYHNKDYKTVSIVTADGALGGSKDYDALQTVTGHNDFITIEKSGVSTMAILGGRLEIAPH
jgi:hypothetical protein